MSQEWKLVPVVPSDEMINAVEHDQYTFATGDEEWIGCISEDMAREIYTNMLAAVPVPHADVKVEVLGMREVMIAYENANAVHLSGTSNFCAVMAAHLNKAFSGHLARLHAEKAALQQRLNVADQRVDELETMLNTPHTAEWFEGVRLEAGHQIGRWGTEHDSGKEPADWFWLIGYLAQKAMTAQMCGDDEKARHHTISTGAAMLNWFRAIVDDSAAMRPGIEKPAA